MRIPNNFENIAKGEENSDNRPDNKWGKNFWGEMAEFPYDSEFPNGLEQPYLDQYILNRGMKPAIHFPIASLYVCLDFISVSVWNEAQKSPKNHLDF